MINSVIMSVRIPKIMQEKLNVKAKEVGLEPANLFRIILDEFCDFSKAETIKHINEIMKFQEANKKAMALLKQEIENYESMRECYIDVKTIQTAREVKSGKPILLPVNLKS